MEETYLLLLAKVAADPEFIQKIKELGSTVDYKDSKQYKAYIQTESAKIQELAETFNIAKQ